MTPSLDWRFSNHELSFSPYDLFLFWSIYLKSSQWLIADLCTILFFFFQYEVITESELLSNVIIILHYFLLCICFTFARLEFLDCPPPFNFYSVSLFFFLSSFIHVMVPSFLHFFHLTNIYDANSIKRPIGIFRLFNNANNPSGSSSLLSKITCNPSGCLTTMFQGHCHVLCSLWPETTFSECCEEVQIWGLQITMCP